MKKPTIKAEPRTLVMSAIPTFDAQGLSDDHQFLTSAGWELYEDAEDHALYRKANGTLQLRGSQDDDNEHRVKWEMTIHANDAQVGYATLTLRPGDMNGSSTQRLVKEALEAAETEFRKWSDALAEAQRQLQV